MSRSITLLSLTLILSSAIFSVPAAAQERALATDKVRVMQKEMAKCVVRRNRENAIAFLENSDANEVDYRTLGFQIRDFERKFDLSACLAAARGGSRTQLNFKPLTFRTLLAEELYLTEHSEPLAITQGSEEFLSNRNIVSVLQRKSAEHFAGFADCLVYRAPAASDRLLRSAPTSDEESAIIQSMVPALSGCIIEGDEMTLTPNNIRAFAADGLWSRSHYGAKTANSEVAT